MLIKMHGMDNFKKFHCLGCATHFGLILSKLASGAGNKMYRSDTSVKNLKE
jgi:hypothetical protein